MEDCDVEISVVVDGDVFLVDGGVVWPVEGGRTGFVEEEVLAEGDDIDTVSEEFQLPAP